MTGTGCGREDHHSRFRARRAETVTTEAVFKLAADLRGLDASLWSQ